MLETSEVSVQDELGILNTWCSNLFSSSIWWKNLGVLATKFKFPSLKLIPEGIIFVEEPDEVALLDLKGNLINLCLFVLLHLSNSSSQQLIHPRQVTSIGRVVIST